MQTRTIELSDLRRMSVLDTATGDRVGGVADMIVHPTDGALVGLVVNDAQDQPFVLDLDAFRVGDNAVMMPAGARREVPDASEVTRRGVRGRQLVGANVITADGRRIGEVTELILAVADGRVVLKCGGSLLQKLFGGGYYLRGDLPTAFSSDGARLIVPSDTEESHAYSKLDEALNTTRSNEEENKG